MAKTVKTPKAKAASATSKKAKETAANYDPKVGDKHWVNYKGELMECEVRHVNAGKGWLTPTHGDDFYPRHIAIAKIDGNKEVECL